MVIKSLLEIDYTCIPKPANGVRLQAKLESENPTGLPVGVVSYAVLNDCPPGTTTYFFVEKMFRRKIK